MTVHPVRQLWSEQFRFKGCQIEGLAAVGRAAVEALDLNQCRRQRVREVEKALRLYAPIQRGAAWLS
jgi:hypothetical protein